MGPQTKQCEQLPEAGKGKEMGSPLSVLKEPAAPSYFGPYPRTHPADLQLFHVPNLSTTPPPAPPSH